MSTSTISKAVAHAKGGLRLADIPSEFNSGGTVGTKCNAATRENKPQNSTEETSLVRTIQGLHACRILPHTDSSVIGLSSGMEHVRPQEIGNSPHRVDSPRTQHCIDKVAWHPIEHWAAPTTDNAAPGKAVYAAAAQLFELDDTDGQARLESTVCRLIGDTLNIERFVQVAQAWLCILDECVDIESNYSMDSAGSLHDRITHACNLVDVQMHQVVPRVGLLLSLRQIATLVDLVDVHRVGDHLELYRQWLEAMTILQANRGQHDSLTVPHVLHIAQSSGLTDAFVGPLLSLLVGASHSYEFDESCVTTAARRVVRLGLTMHNFVSLLGFQATIERDHSQLFARLQRHFDDADNEAHSFRYRALDVPLRWIQPVLVAVADEECFSTPDSRLHHALSELCNRAQITVIQAVPNLMCIRELLDPCQFRVLERLEANGMMILSDADFVNVYRRATGSRVAPDPLPNWRPHGLLDRLRLAQVDVCAIFADAQSADAALFTEASHWPSSHLEEYEASLNYGRLFRTRVASVTSPSDETYAVFGSTPCMYRVYTRPLGVPRFGDPVDSPDIDLCDPQNLASILHHTLGLTQVWSFSPLWSSLLKQCMDE